MSGLAAAGHARVAAVREVSPPAAEAPGLELALRVAAFAALCLFATLHFSRLVAHAPAGRVLLVTALATAAAAAMGVVAAGLVRVPARASGAIRALIGLATFAATLLAVGLPARYLAPAHWDELREGIDRGITGTSTISWPYAAGDSWIRLTILLAIPAAATLAAVLAFAPRGPRAREAGRMAGLVVLVGLYTFGVTEIGLGSPVTRGLLLLALIAAWLWLPRVRRRDATAAAAVVLGAAVIAIPLSHTLDSSDPWIDWKHWSWFSAAGGERFQWDHRYGPLDWPRTGRTLLLVRSSRPHYWKAETLDRFDGVRWMHSNYYVGVDAGTALPDQLEPRWLDTIHVALRDLHTNVLIGAGTLVDYDGAHAIATSGDGTTRLVDEPAGKGESYDIRAYVPDPSARQMRAIPADTSADVQPYVAFELPSRSPRDPAGPGGLVRLAPWSASTAAGGRNAARLLASPYGRVYELARQLSAGQPTTYDVVKRIQGYLQDRYSYSEQPPPSRYPLAAFLFKDRVGYCQQFSGAMALMLRMNGIPARVAAGFSPGIYDSTNREYNVRDFDAHSWVEVWFRGIGWVPFDPTPTISPASSQAAGSAATTAANGDSHDTGATSPREALEKQADPKAGGIGDDGAASALWIGIATVVAVLALAVAAFWLAVTVRARRLRRGHDEPAIAELAAALELLGYPLVPGTTLTQLERRLRVVAGDRAARYVRMLRDGRFSPRAADAPTRADRRALRSALTAGRGPLGRLHGLVALPPRLRHGQPPAV